MFDALRENKGDTQQIIGREGETATFLFSLSVTLTLCGSGFAPPQLNRSAASLFSHQILLSTKFPDKTI
jgi:hypothetical protein